MTTIASKIIYLTVAGKRIFSKDISITPSLGKPLMHRYQSKNETLAIEEFKDRVMDSEYIGDCTIVRFNRMAHLIKVDPNFYAAMDMKTNNIFYVSSNLNDFKILEKITDTTFVVDGIEYDAATIEMSKHFIDQAGIRLRVSPDKVREQFIEVLVNGRYIGVTYSSDSKTPAHLFVKDNRMVYISPDFSTAVTTYYSSNKNQFFNDEIKEKIINLMFNELKKMNKVEAKIGKNLKLITLETNLRIAEIEIEIFKTSSESKIESLTEEKERIINELATLRKEWEELVDKIRNTSIGLASFL